jgi:hypothetical protein
MAISIRVKPRVVLENAPFSWGALLPKTGATTLPTQERKPDRKRLLTARRDLSFFKGLFGINLSILFFLSY